MQIYLRMWKKYSIFATEKHKYVSGDLHFDGLCGPVGLNVCGERFAYHRGASGQDDDLSPAHGFDGGGIAVGCAADDAGPDDRRF